VPVWCLRGCFTSVTANLPISVAALSARHRPWQQRLSGELAGWPDSLLNA
jgi:hypothetical protein